jgi:hypothetical protein
MVNDWGRRQIAGTGKDRSRRQTAGAGELSLASWLGNLPRAPGPTWLLLLSASCS